MLASAWRRPQTRAMLGTWLLLALLVCAVWAWMDALTARERAVRFGQELCRDAGVPLYVAGGGLMPKLVGTGYETVVTALAIVEQRRLDLGAGFALQHAVDPHVVEFAELTTVRDRGQLLVVEEHRPIQGLGQDVDDLPGTLGQIATDDPVILLVHEPDIFTKVPPRVALTLAGHTHGGQIVFPMLPPLFVPSEYGARFAYGHIVENDRHMIVSGGLGTSFVPLRLGVPPEILRVRLGRA